jgi:hypothetical protein
MREDIKRGAALWKKVFEGVFSWGCGIIESGVTGIGIPIVIFPNIQTFISIVIGDEIPYAW